MNRITIHFSAPVRREYKYGEVDYESVVETSSLSLAKKLIKENLDKYVDSCITKVYASGEWEVLGPVKLSGSNKHFIANTRMTKAGY